MDLNLRLIRSKEFIKASPTGKFDLEMGKQLLLKLARENAAPRQYDVLIFEARPTLSLSLVDITSLAQVMIENRDSFREKLAILTSFGRQYYNAKFMELYAGNRGFQVAAFEYFEEALNWLALKGDDDEP